LGKVIFLSPKEEISFLAGVRCKRSFVFTIKINKFLPPGTKCALERTPKGSCSLQDFDSP
jgi:hypothetical protein